MQINFLQDAGGSRLTKTFTATETHPYPNAATFSSFHYDITTLDEFYDALQAHSKLGHCLLKGALAAPLKEERRAGKTTPLDPTEYLVLDLDFDQGFSSIDEFMAAIGLSGVDYILHHSSSSGIRSKPGLRAHIIVLLHTPKPPALLKTWLQHLNVTVPQLRDQCQLSANGFTVKWALDVTTCQNDKLIYIADPNVQGIEDPMAGKRFELCKRLAERWTFPFQGSEFHSLTTSTEELINERREQAGLPQRKAVYGNGTDQGEDIKYLKNPSRAVVTSWKEARGFMYVNLNNGDSWGYYYPVGRPEFLRNFKGEPIVRLRDIDPEYYANVTASAPVAETPAIEKPTKGEVLRWPVINTIGDNEWALITWSEQELDVNISKSRAKVIDLYEGHGETFDTFQPWRIEFAPWRRDKQIDPQTRWINTFVPTPYMAEKGQGKPRIPPLIQKVLLSAFVDQETVDHFLHWLAYIWKTGRPAKTAWLLKGVEGTGKGAVFNSMIAKLFGPSTCFSAVTDKALEKHNGWMVGKMFLLIDEAEIKSDKGEELMSKLKNLITEPTIAFRSMHSDSKSFTNTLNILVATNSKTPIIIRADDRRWNIAPTQNVKLKKHMDVKVLDKQIEAVLPDFAAYLTAMKIDEENPPEALDNEAKRELVETSINSNEEFFNAFAAGDLDYFCESFFNSPYPKTQPHRPMFRLALAGWAKRIDKTDWVLNTELYAAYYFISNSYKGEVMRVFGKNCAREFRAADQCTIGGQSLRGWKITWKLTNESWMPKLEDLIAEVEAEKEAMKEGKVTTLDTSRGRIAR